MNDNDEMKSSSKKSVIAAADNCSTPAEPFHKSTQEEVQIPSCVYLEPLIHEDQSLQLCALHTINNLLQLKKRTESPPSTSKSQIVRGGGTDNGSVVLKEALLCGGRFFYSSSNLEESVNNNNTTRADIATTAELNHIADDLTHREYSLLTQGTSNEPDDTTRTPKLSLMQKMNSHHRTVVAGNYSFEVLEAFLSKRQVSLKWFPTDQHSMESLDTTTFSKGTEQQQQQQQQQQGVNDDDCSVVIGFVLNATDANSSIWSSMFHSVFGGERHWFAITRLRRCWIPPSIETDESTSRVTTMNTTTTSEHENTPLFLDSETDVEVEYDSNLWHVVDSDSTEIMELTTRELWDFLKEVERDGGTVLQAILNHA
jgi:hypothetical protein